MPKDKQITIQERKKKKKNYKNRDHFLLNLQLDQLITSFDDELQTNPSITQHVSTNLSPKHQELQSEKLKHI